MTARTFTDEVLDDKMAEILRAKTPAERLKICCRLWEFAAELIRSNLKHQHPDWPAEKLDRETARRMSHGAF